MPIMAAQGRNDARTAARMLATAAIDCLERPGSVPSQTVVLNNVYRLLEAYRVNSFFGLTSSADYRSGTGAFSHPPLEQHVGVVRDVLGEAVATAFNGMSKDAALTEIETVLKGVAYPDRVGPPSAVVKAKAVRFFSEVVQRL